MKDNKGLLNELGIFINPEEVDDLESVSKKIVSILRFIDKNIVENIKNFEDGLSMERKITNKTKDDNVKRFIREQEDRVDAYAGKVFRDLSENDLIYAEEIIKEKLHIKLQEMKEIIFAGESKDHHKLDESNLLTEEEKGIHRAGDERTTPITELIVK